MKIREMRSYHLIVYFIESQVNHMVLICMNSEHKNDGLCM